MARLRWIGVVGLGLAACGPAVTADTDGGEGSSSSTTSGTTSPGVTTSPPPSTSGSTSTAGTTSTPDTTDSTTGGDSTGSSSTGTPPPNCGEEGCALDVLVVVDNSSRMGGAQRALALSMIELDAQLRAIGADFQVMFTTTDFGNPLCTPFEPRGYDPARGAPISTACTQRITDFTGLGSNPDDATASCTDVCPDPTGPITDPFVAFDGLGGNVPELLPDVDIDGDGEPETPVARALACLAPMGINGCGYESPLENMLQALNPSAAWNQGPRPFVREGAALGIVLLTDELDCSVADYAIMTDPAFQEIAPNTGSPQASSALCWNAGLDCEGPADDGTYDCTPSAEQRLQPLQRYEDYLNGQLADTLGKPVFMLGLLGVPTVTEHLARPPYTPVAGGLLDLQIDDWQEADVLPDDADLGITAADQQFNYGVGPGCSSPESTSRAQAIPPVRTAALCDSLSGPEATRCCIESICDDDYTAGMRCLTGMFADVQAR